MKHRENWNDTKQSVRYFKDAGRAARSVMPSLHSKLYARISLRIGDQIERVVLARVRQEIRRRYQ